MGEDGYGGEGGEGESEYTEEQAGSGHHLEVNAPAFNPTSSKPLDQHGETARV